MIAAQANDGRLRIVVRTPQTWTGFAAGVIVGGLGVAWLASHAPAARNLPVREMLSPHRASSTDRLASALSARAGLTAAEEGRLRAVLADGQQTWQTAVAYFESDEGADRTASAPGQMASAHREEIDGLVTDSIRERLVEALGVERARQVEKRVGSLAALAGTTAPATSHP
jgi:crotonobetainyl-CoA:carnitine CoA-transferase CaiB-like acyl-CoA transferase